MDLILPTLGGVLAIFIGLYLIYAVRVSRASTEAERDLTPIYM